MALRYRQSTAAVNVRRPIRRVGVTRADLVRVRLGMPTAPVAEVVELAPGRTLVAIGSGDSAAFNVGLRPASLAELREYAETIRSLLTTGTAMYRGAKATLTWKRAPVPLYLAASGPKTLRLAGQIADGVVIRTGIAPDIVRDSIAQVETGAREAGRDPSTIDKWWWPDVNVAGSYQEAVDEIKMSLAAAGNHLSRFTTEGKHIPPDLLEKVKILGQRYAYSSHTLPHSPNNRLIEELGLVDYLADRFAAVGTPEDCIKKLRAAVDAGARQFWMSVHFDDKERFLRDWASRVAPAFR
jgi:5,10-methylenetetrahydromethanopterin reductase